PLNPPGVIRFTPLTELLPQDQLRKVLNGTAEERRAGLLALAPEKRWQVLAMVSPNVLEGLPDLQQDAVEAKKKQQEDRMMEMRKLRPPLNELLAPGQLQIAQRGTREQRES